MDASDAHKIASAKAPVSHSRFFGTFASAAIGAGAIIHNVEYPAYLSEEGRFGVVRGLILVLTHECDLDQRNERLFNDTALICPIIPMENFVQSCGVVLNDESLETLIANVVARHVNRLIYFPVVPEVLPLGGFVYLNLISNTHLSKLTEGDSETICMLGDVGLREFDYALERHLRRPKADRIPYQYGSGEHSFNAAGGR